MADKPPVSKKGFSADWLMRGVLTKIGDSFDRLTGRRWVPSSSLAASELVERIKKLLEAEAKEVHGKGTVVPHNIKLKMQWDKFSDESGEAIKSLRTELLTAVIDHINDSLYYTFAAVSLEVKPDYFIEGVKLYVSFDKFTDEESDVEENVTIPGVNVSEIIPSLAEAPASNDYEYIARFETNGKPKEKRLEFPVGRQRSVGRTSANDLMLDDSSISKIHASLVADENGGLSVADTGSTNGTFINGQRIAYGKAIRLEDGDKVKFGVINVTFEHVPKPVSLEPGKTISVPVGRKTKINGFEFTDRVSPETSLEASDDSSDTSEIPVLDEPIKIVNESDGNSEFEKDAALRKDAESDDLYKTRT